jgi:PAS domain S-box-containing protein
MSETGSLLVVLGDPRLASYAVGNVPVWLWSADATRVLWGNPAAAAIFNAPTSRALTGHTIDPKGSAALQIARLAGSLPHAAAPRLERLRGFGGRMGGALMCSCSRIVLADRTPAILVVATEAAGPRLSLDEQARRLLAGADKALALFAPDGSLLYATSSAEEKLGGHASLVALGAAQIAATAFASGHAERETEEGRTSLYRIGTGVWTLLLASFHAASQPAALEEPTPRPPDAERTEAESISPEPEPEPTPELESNNTSEPIAQSEPDAAAQPAAELTSEPLPFYELALPTPVMAPVTLSDPVEPPKVMSAEPAEPASEASAETEAPVSLAPPAVEDAPPVAEQSPPSAEAPPPAATENPRLVIARALAERRQPLRFVWQVDADGRFTVGSEEFTALLGPNTAAAFGQSWDEIAKALALDPEGQVTRAIASHNTWSGITVSFPVDDTDIRLPIELSGLPVFDRDRNFRGYRGFGICRAVARIAELALARRNTAGPAEPPVFREATASPSETPINVVPFRAPSAVENTPTLTVVERNAFSELATRLTARLRSSKDKPEADEHAEPDVPTAELEAELRLPSKDADTPARPPSADQRQILDRLPVGVLVYRLDRLIYANRAFLDWTGYPDLRALEDAGGLDALFVEPTSDVGEDSGTQSLSIATNQGDKLPVDARLFTSPWEGESALVLMLSGVVQQRDREQAQERFQELVPETVQEIAQEPAQETVQKTIQDTTPESAQAPAPEPAQAAQEPVADDRHEQATAALRGAQAELRDARAMLDLAADGLIMLDRDAQVIWVSRGAQTLFGYDDGELIGLPFATLFAEESQRAALDALKSADPAKLRGRDLIGRRREGSLVPLFMTASTIKADDERHFAVFRDMTPWKKTESELLNAKRQAEKASSAKSDFLAKISHEIRTPLNAIIGFAEVMIQERFGSIGNERYQQYLKDIHSSGDHLLSLLNDLLDLSKIEAGKLDLKFARVDLNDLAQESVALMQPQANRERIIIRTSLGPTLPTVTADARSVRQILLNLLSNSIKFTGVGGQVIVSTAVSDDGDVILRVRDTGVGMSEQDIAVALEPFRQLATSARFGSGGTGLGLPLTKALAEANRASFKIKSAVNTGTLVEVAFPSPRMAAE